MINTNYTTYFYLIFVVVVKVKAIKVLPVASSG